MDTPPYNALICRYSEIGTKGRNRVQFEEHLLYGLVRAFLKIGRLRTQYEHGRIFLFPPKGREVFTEEECKVVKDRTATIPGVSSISPGFYTEPTFEAIRDVVMRTFPAFCGRFLEGHAGDSPSYAIRARRSDKSFPMTCNELERSFAERLLPLYPQLHLDLKHPDFRVDVEIRQHQAFVSYESYGGPGGLPGGTGGDVLALLSGGFDSPVACFEMMLRGCHVDFLTFHSEPYTPPAYLTKVARIAKALNQYQKRGRLIAVNLLPVQKAIRDNCKSRYRTVLYRRMMLRIATEIARRATGGLALLTGDNLGQVASQTLRNMSVIDRATEMLVLRPLLSFEKLRIMEVAREIQTYDISIEPVPDSCTVFAPEDPCTTSFPDIIEEEEKAFPVTELLEEALSQAIYINPNSLSQYPVFSTEGREFPMQPKEAGE